MQPQGMLPQYRQLRWLSRLPRKEKDINLNLVELAQAGCRLEHIRYHQPQETDGGIGITSLFFKFENTEEIALSVNADTDELFWGGVSGIELLDLTEIIPCAEDAYGLALTWSWEMKNQQGFFDAIQLEFTDISLSKAVIIQFKAAASAIWAFRVEPMGFAENDQRGRSE